MKALTLWQPWASLVACGYKTLETRIWSTSYRGPLAIHAAKRKPPYAADEFDAMHSWSKQPQVRELVGDFGKLPRGAVLAFATLVDVLPIGREFPGDPMSRVTVGGEMLGDLGVLPLAELRCGDFTPGRFAWVLRDIVPTEPLPAKGRQGLWDYRP